MRTLQPVPEGTFGFGAPTAKHNSEVKPAGL